MSETTNKVTVEKFRVKRRLGLLSSISFIVGSIIGSGIFISPRNVLAKTGSVGLCLVVWALCGVISMCAALVYAELGTLIRKSGGEHAYYLKSYGSFAAFIERNRKYKSQSLEPSESMDTKGHSRFPEICVGCTDSSHGQRHASFVLITDLTHSRNTLYIIVGCSLIPSGITVQALTLAEYLSEVIFDGCGQSPNMKKVIATTAVLSVAITNSISVRLAARVQIFFTFVKLMGLVVIMGGGIWWVSQGKYGSLVTGFEGTTDDVQDVALAVYSGMWAYGGWSALNTVTEEIQEPKRNLPLAIVISVILVTIVYLLVNASYLAVLTKTEFLSSWAVGVTWAEQVIPPAVILIPIVVICSVYGASNGASFTSSRLLFQAARENHLPELCSYIHVKSRIPLPSVILLTTLSVIFMIPAEITTLLNLLSFLAWLFTGMTMVAVIILRWKMKDAERVIKLPLVIPVFVLLICIYLVIAPFLQNPKVEFLYALAFLGLGALVYIPMVHFKLQIPGLVTLTRWTQCLLEVVPTDIVTDDEL